MGWIRQTRQLLGLALIAVTIAGCADGGPPPSRSTPPQVTVTPSVSPTTSPDGSLRGRLVAALRAEAPNSSAARMVETGELTVLPTTWLVGWQIIDVVNSTLAHPQRFYLGLSADGAVIHLTAKPDEFNRMLGLAQPRITSAQVATELAGPYLDSTRDFRRYSYRIDSVDDIDWRPQLDADQQRVRGRVEREFRTQVTRPEARRSGGDWLLSAWMVYDHELVRHDLTVTAEGLVTDRPHTRFADLPTPISV